MNEYFKDFVTLYAILYLMTSVPFIVLGIIYVIATTINNCVYLYRYRNSRVKVRDVEKGIIIHNMLFRPKYYDSYPLNFTNRVIRQKVKID